MHNAGPEDGIAAVGGLLTVLAPAAAKADPPAFPSTRISPSPSARRPCSSPSEVGVASDRRRIDRQLRARLVVAAPVSGWFGDHTLHHRIVGGVDLLPHSDGADWRGRLGYRYGRRWAFGGVGVGIDGAGASLSPSWA